MPRRLRGRGAGRLAHPAGDVAVEVADEHEARGRAARARTPRTSAGPRAPSGARGPMGSGDAEQAAGRSAQEAWLDRVVDVVGVAAAGVQAGDDVERGGVDVEHLDARPVAGELELDGREPDGARPAATAASGCPTRRR